MTTTPADDLEALRRRRAEAAVEADRIADLLDRFPSQQRRSALQAVSGLIDKLDRLIATAST
jgi:hypothetical protein